MTKRAKKSSKDMCQFGPPPFPPPTEHETSEWHKAFSAQLSVYGIPHAVVFGPSAADPIGMILTRPGMTRVQAAVDISKALSWALAFLTGEVRP